MADQTKKAPTRKRGAGAQGGNGNGGLPAPFRPPNEASALEEIRERADTV